MKFSIFYQKILRVFLISSLIFLSLSCGTNKASKDTPINAMERARKNVEEGRGI